MCINDAHSDWRIRYYHYCCAFVNAPAIGLMWKPVNNRRKKASHICCGGWMRHNYVRQSAHQLCWYYGKRTLVHKSMTLASHIYVSMISIIISKHKQSYAKRYKKTCFCVYRHCGLSRSSIWDNRNQSFVWWFGITNVLVAAYLSVFALVPRSRHHQFVTHKNAPSLCWQENGAREVLNGRFMFFGACARFIITRAWRVWCVVLFRVTRARARLHHEQCSIVGIYVPGALV